MSLLFNRICSVEISGSGESKTFSDFTISFSINKTSEYNSNKASISIYNINPDNRFFSQKKDLSLKLSVGYAGEYVENTSSNPVLKKMNVLFTGDVLRSESNKSGVDFITTFECGDAHNTINESKITKSYSSGTSLKSIINDVVKTFGVDVGKKSDIPDSKFENGFSVSDLSKNVLTKLLKPSGLEWNIQNNVLQISKPNKATSSEIFDIGYDSGLIGSVGMREEGVEFSCLLNPLIKPGIAINLRYNENGKEKSGQYRIREVSHDGNNRNGSWVSKCVAIGIER